MESEHFLNAGIPLPPPPPPPTIHLEPILSSSILTWPLLPSSLEMRTNNNSSLSNWEKSTINNLQFDSALCSLVSSPAASNSNLSNDNFMIRELIGKLGNMGGGEISSQSQHMITNSYITKTTGNNSTNTSSYNTPLNSPPKINLHHAMEQIQKESLNFPGLEKPPVTTGLNSSAVAVPFATDLGLAERAARFSCFGSRSFNGRTNQLGLNNPELAYNGGSPLMGSGNLSRVSSSPSLEAIGFQKASNELNSRKRKAASTGKAKELPANVVKDAETTDNSDTKRGKSNEGNGSENSPSSVKAEEEYKVSGDDDSKPPEPPKDYIHVRARRGQATDSHSLAERVRREKISERMKLLQDLVPGCNKVTGKALMLDEIINYVQSLQRRVEFLSMKLASVNTRPEFIMDTTTSKNIFQSHHQLPHPLFPLDSSASAFFCHQPLQNQVLRSNNISNGSVSLDPLDTLICQNPSMQLHQVDAFNASVPLYSTLCEGDLQTIVQMGFGQNPR